MRATGIQKEIGGGGVTTHQVGLAPNFLCIILDTSRERFHQLLSRMRTAHAVRITYTKRAEEHMQANIALC